MFHLEVMYPANGCQLKRKLKIISTPTRLNTTPTSTPSCPAARCARTVAANPHLQRKFQMPTPRWNDDASTPIKKNARYHGFAMSCATVAYVDVPCVSQRSV